MFKVVLTDYEFETLEFEQRVLDESGLKINFVSAQCKSEDEVIEVAKDADAIINQYAPLSERVLRSLTKCKVISRYGVGVDTIDLNIAKELGIKVCNVPDYGIEEVSNHTLALLMAWTRKVIELNNAVKNGIWNFNVGKPIYRFENRTFAIFGFGRIPRRVIEKIQPLGLTLIGYDPFVSAEEMAKYGVRKVELDEAIKLGDILSFHVPLVEQTMHLLNKERLTQLKDGVFIINTARGPIIETEALIQGLKSKKIAGAALDVIEHEPIEAGHELLTFDNVYLTPHSAFYSEEAIEELRTKATKNVVDVLAGQQPTYVVV
ncbi:2-hydroxyacid dehydrogenase [Ureibacillus massiliensis 4400831 = CIP 108448 = CCUG 49529]|uniref:2-hydroxyacid dehydrogenase n=1 Tax=Ureibacillus massiliensis 4400831 = CIP 108448 = CCUG 49529 TaxID=1211035 RepID=A0A0A3J7F6_9BACL|nr:C-terminal binding protein [Ureibacillus massiliensis]KGR91123.1 2-hydroxyacid dehydrogenase [Ureibacillus massiliensis 4400831 = CIP 108448 = CCUG 49529]BDH62641.1 dehydrogenase [Lysinibacillus sp. PLM2]